MMKKKLAALFCCVCLFAAAIAAPGGFVAKAATTVGAFTVTGGTNGTDYTFEKGDTATVKNGQLTVLTSTKLTITTNGKVTTDCIVIKKNVAAHIVLDSLHINTVMNDQVRRFPPALKIEDDSTANVTVEIVGSVSLISGMGYAGIQKTGGADSGTLRITGKTDSFLKAYGGRNAAGIGGISEYNQNHSVYHIYIEGGAVSAFGGLYGAAIGCGASNRDCGDIRITNASVKTTPGEGAAAIGSGRFVDEATTTCTATKDGKTPVYLCLIPPAKKTLTIDGVAYTPRHDYIINKVCAYLPAGYHRIVRDGTPSVCLTDADGNITDVAYTVRYDSNGGSLSYPSKTVTNRNTALWLPDNETREGYLFSGWLYKGRILPAGVTLEDIEGDLSVTDITLTAVWTPTKQVMSDLDTLKNAVKALTDALNNKIDVASFNLAVNNLNQNIFSAEQRAKQFATDADSALRTELLAEIEKAKQAAAEGAGPAIEAAKKELAAAIDKKADAETVNAAIKNLNTAIENAEKAAKAYADAQDERLKTELSNSIAAAKADAVAAANAALETAKKELSAAIDKKADAATVNAAIENLNVAIENAETAAKAYADVQDAKLKAALESAIAAAKADAVAAANAALETAKKELAAAIDKKADAETVNAAIKNLNAAIENAETAAKAYADAQDAKLKAELSNSIAAAKAELSDVIAALAENVDRAKDALRKALADGDAALEEKIKALDAALRALDEAYRAADKEQDALTEQKTADAKAVMSAASLTLAERLDTVEKKLHTHTVVTAAAIAVFALFDAAAVALFIARKKKT